MAAGLLPELVWQQMALKTSKKPWFSEVFAWFSHGFHMFSLNIFEHPPKARPAVAHALLLGSTPEAAGWPW